MTLSKIKYKRFYLYKGIVRREKKAILIINIISKVKYNIITIVKNI